MTIAKNKAVLIHYTLKDDKGDILDSSEGQDPLGYIHGIGALIPGLEAKLEGMSAGDNVTAVIPPAEAYGEPSDDMVQAIPKSELNELGELQVGLQLSVQMPDGGAGVATITSIDDDTVTFDMNHPLAGETLHFDVNVVEVRDATQDELDHGHLHGEENHDH